ncbi:ionotropic receptor 93a-like [Macrobrachium nipponense]|uniref:ionotropic receptor 93a-like n=1 Tax=Macrobrachium nipponense TaxID=159736 RepID=UPI0030C845DA
MVRVGSWSQEDGLTVVSNFQLYPEKYLNFFGAEVGMTVWPFMPYFMAREEPVDASSGAPSGSTSNYTGRDYIMLETMNQFLNFSIKFIPTKSWDEVILLVKQRVSFMSPMKLAIMPHLLKELDFTVPIEPATLTFSMAKPTLKPRWQSLYYPLTGQVWASILAMMIIMPIVFIVITNIGNARENKGLPGRIILEMTGTLLGQNFTSEPSTTNLARLLVGFWVVFAFIMGTAYRGNLTAFLTIPKYPPRAENLPQLLAKNAKYENLFLFTTFAGSYAIFKGATSIAP